MYKVGHLIKIARISKGIGQDELAKKIGVSKNYISLVENSKKKPGVEFLKQVASFLEVPLLLLMWENINLPSAKTPAEKEIKSRLIDIAEKAQQLFSDQTLRT